ncbi:hypothetical protein [Streptomyces sp. NPDC057287]|uniref:hypothetical protein n=1 Tax=Streptomyces sp. NPDC057287 TaxID=3346086 RepID=UPI00363D0A34
MLFLLLLLAVLAGAVLAVLLLVRGLRAVVRSGDRSGPSWARAAALLTGAAALALYVWGMAHVEIAVLDAEDGGTDSAPIGPCREDGPESAERVDGYDVGWIPLRFDCHLTGGGTYTTSTVPGYVNPATALLALTAAVSGIFAVGAAERADRTPAPSNRKHDS